jgi:hypothetical protein
MPASPLDQLTVELRMREQYFIVFTKPTSSFLDAKDGEGLSLSTDSAGS